MRIKQERLSAIKQIIETMNISTQEELISELEKQGYDVTQATVSRDISDLGLQKVKIIKGKAAVSTGRQIYSLPEIERLRSLLNEFMVSIDKTDNLVVVKSHPGTAQAVAAAIDAVKWHNVLGTVGGDDTILVITRTSDVADFIVERLSKLREEKTL
ncbi:MAG: arginine repressor [Candidatus Aquicultor secundus]|uniref:Arginine repressor n=1 Tax=Candidatus Aquicultor secundus TaxID=1973895 RepID=A0A2M7T6Q0_9ACTN|nr:arginine repressor [Candidatus Aquicultor secundus]NCO66606.1 arginine repressor [Solirubrobacter sp.]OIO85445.1 MAG: arginine repressor [Candidatus Aquicultor secundus]PIU27218.1 MAG: arginine repressor [Candidatus Aquicultor secundus]PIW22688.1 MAG: arginine repressor [Candidatus Aquicultor secundus]PIX51477.1 MAG: arginine repressor [Candidatus Aquicultor secundus]